jgi:hypothetical protein
MSNTFVEKSTQSQTLLSLRVRAVIVIAENKKKYRTTWKPCFGYEKTYILTMQNWVSTV